MTHTLIFVVVAALVAVLAISISTIAQAQQKNTGNTTNGTIGNIRTGINNTNLMASVESQSVLINRAKLLHNGTSDPELEASGQLLTCVQALFLKVPAGHCNDMVTRMVINHQFGTNQTILGIAHGFLKAKGIER